MRVYTFTDDSGQERPLHSLNPASAIPRPRRSPYQRAAYLSPEQARAFLRAPDLLILDEATNAVDSITEAEIQAAIDALSERCTILVIAHRLSTLHKADEVVVLDAGRVVQLGSPQQLLAEEGLLARQYALE